MQGGQGKVKPLHNPTGKKRILLLILLSMLAFLGPLNIDMYLPSFPGIATDFGVSAAYVQFSLTACLIGLAVGQLIVGPISDAQGRRKPLLVGTLLFVLASILCALVSNIWVLIVGRFPHGFAVSG